MTPEQHEDIYHIVRLLEEKKVFLSLLEHLDISSKVSVFIGDEHIGGDLKNSTIIVKKIKINSHNGYVGIIGSIKMDYAFNIAMLRQIL